MSLRFRPTRRQALATGLLYGAGCALVAGAVMAFIAHRLVLLGAALLVPLVLGGVAGLVLVRRRGVDADERGVHEEAATHSWPRVLDLRAERRGGRTQITAYLDNGVRMSLRAPYDGRLLARDRGFEHKYFTLRQLWENHRRWNLPV